MTVKITIKRIYEPLDKEDGYRVLVDRLWPRGLRREDADFDIWAKDLAPSPSLRKWFAHDDAKFDEFRSRYIAELEEKRQLIAKVLRESRGTLTLLYAARNRSHNHAAVLRDFLAQR